VSKSDLKRICLDTNVYIIGTQDPDSDEAKILQAIGYYGKEQLQLEAEIVLIVLLGNADCFIIMIIIPTDNLILFILQSFNPGLYFED
jgi:hypothetical protein